MGRRGPRPKSPELESLQGHPGRRKKQTKAALAAADDVSETVGDDIQDDTHDSRFVQPPPYLIGKAERSVWAEIMSGPNAHLWFKFSDHRVIARYCHLAVAYDRLTKSLPKPTYKTKATNGAEVIKRNPAFDQWMALSRELRSVEQLIAGNPGARLGLEKQGLGGSNKPSADGPDPSEVVPKSKPSDGPIGLLKSPTKMN